MLEIILTIIIAIALFLAINTSIKNKHNVDMETSEFKTMLKKEGLGDDLINFCLLVISKLQKQEGTTDNSLINSKVFNRLNGWEYSDVLSEQDYDYLYSTNSEEINNFHEEAMNNYGFVPADLGEARHTENWSQGAQYAETVITQKISDVISKYKSNQM